MDLPREGVAVEADSHQPHWLRPRTAAVPVAVAGELLLQLGPELGLELGAELGAEEEEEEELGELEAEKVAGGGRRGGGP